MMQADDIRKQRTRAEEIDAQIGDLDSSLTLAVWVIAEQLYEIRALAGIALEQKGGK